MNLETVFCGIKMKTPIIAASGTFGYGIEYRDYLPLEKIGAISVKGLSLKPWRGNEGVRIAETPSGILNCIGLENPGTEVFLHRILPELRHFDVPVIANIVGNTSEEYGQVAEMLSVDGVAGLEVNISCPNVKVGGVAFGIDKEMAAEVTREVKRHTDLPVIVKLSPNVTDIVSIAKAVEAAGADALSLINTLLGMAVDVRSRKPVLGNVTGGLSGPAVKPIALRMVWQVAQSVGIPVCGLGGIMTGTDAVEFLLAGARTVQVGSATLTDPFSVLRITEELRMWCEAEGVEDVNTLVGALQESM